MFEYPTNREVKRVLNKQKDWMSFSMAKPNSLKERLKEFCGEYQIHDFFIYLKEPKFLRDVWVPVEDMSPLSDLKIDEGYSDRGSIKLIGIVTEFEKLSSDRDSESRQIEIISDLRDVRISRGVMKIMGDPQRPERVYIPESVFEEY